jgi:hypothetical protein
MKIKVFYMFFEKILRFLEKILYIIWLIILIKEKII